MDTETVRKQMMLVMFFFMVFSVASALGGVAGPSLFFTFLDYPSVSALANFIGVLILFTIVQLIWLKKGWQIIPWLGAITFINILAQAIWMFSVPLKEFVSFGGRYTTQVYSSSIADIAYIILGATTLFALIFLVITLRFVYSHKEYFSGTELKTTL